MCSIENERGTEGWCERRLGYSADSRATVHTPKRVFVRFHFTPNYLIHTRVGKGERRRRRGRKRRGREAERKKEGRGDIAAQRERGHGVKIYTKCGSHAIPSSLHGHGLTYAGVWRIRGGRAGWPAGDKVKFQLVSLRRFATRYYTVILDIRKVFVRRLLLFR